jgi:hypothetical protein
MKSNCFARFPILLCSAHTCDVRKHSAKTCGEPPLPMKKRNSSKKEIAATVADWFTPKFHFHFHRPLFEWIEDMAINCRK